MLEGFDPYDTLMEAMERIQRLEVAHNKLATAYNKSEQELNTALKSLNRLQQNQLMTMRSVDLLAGHLHPTK